MDNETIPQEQGDTQTLLGTGEPRDYQEILPKSDLREDALELVHRLVVIAEYKHQESLSHLQRISHYTMLLASVYGLDDFACETLRFASPLHDIGNLGIPEDILLKPGKLSTEEWELMKTHPTIGAKLLSGSNSPFMQAGQLIAAAHHERWDGSGYPLGLSGDQIPIWARITTVADVFDALTTQRPYESAWSVEDAVEVIRLGSETQFDPWLVETFLKVLPEWLKIRDRFPQKTRRAR
jgi:putative two-component system response regulator